jgi:hypothetical protein
MNSLFPKKGIDSLAIGGGCAAGVAVFGQIAFERILCVLWRHFVSPKFAT